MAKPIDVSSLMNTPFAVKGYYYHDETFETIEVGVGESGRMFVAAAFNHAGDITVATRGATEAAAVKDLLRVLGPNWFEAVDIGESVEALRAHYGARLAAFTDEEIEEMVGFANDNALATAAEKGLSGWDAQHAANLMFAANMDHQIDLHEGK